ncbi:phosphotransferase [Vibrio algarum]|uniref:Phosphotransferase n=1 Tax=Vibrio algarum TaxID=3020714 RepID=A0ABT4YPS9_9VIBR|nr:phosphotransferase [Vibrio sp. KJ40-1]MDB1123559.1 phosphotransferase [Vibrio sp. KJ40-1]
MTWSEAKSLDQSLLSLDSFFIEPPQIAEILPGGLTNRCWKITSHSGTPYVWRPSSIQLFQFGISRIRENQLLESLRECHFAPTPIHLNDKGLLVEWLEGSVGDVPLSNIELIGTLSKIHSVNIHNKPVPLFAYTAKVDGYWHKLNLELKSKQREQIYNLYRELPDIPQVEPTLCHFDLGNYNIVRTVQGIKVIDWEYAGVSDPRMDLAMTLELSGYNMPKSVAMYCKLRNIEDIDRWLVGVNQWQPRNHMMAMLWYLLGYQLWRDNNYLLQAERLEALLIR